MNLTLKSLQTEMHTSLSDISLRIEKLDTNLNERVDSILLRFDGHIKQTAHEFQNVDERFSEIDKRFDKIDKRFDRLTSDIIGSLSPYFTNIEKMLSNHENRISVLERKH